MIEKTGTVERVDGNYAVIQAEDVEFYHHFVLSLYRVQTKFEEDELVTFYALNTIGAKPGDRVRFTIPVKSFFDTTYIEYIFLALVVLIAFVFDLTVIVIGVVIYILFKLRPKDGDEKAPSNEPEIVEIIDQT